MSEPVEVHVGGRTYRVVASAGEAAVQRLASLVDARLREHAGPAAAFAPQSLLLAAISLAHDLEQERQRRLEVEQRSRDTLRSALARIDAAIAEADRVDQQPAIGPPLHESLPPPEPPGPG
jgi:cell division protein ZapA